MEREGSVAFVCLRWKVVCDQVRGRVRFLCCQSCLVALCKQLLCSVIAWYLGSGCGLILDRQAAWRPGFSWVGVVKVIGGTVQAVAVFSDCEVLGSGCGLRLGRQAAWRPGYIWVGVVKVIGGTVQAVAVRGPWALAAGSDSVVKLLGGRGTFGLVSSK